MKTLLSNMLALWLLALCQNAAAETPINPQGKILGGKMSDHPAWFKESFLDIAADVDEASSGGKHVILFLHLDGCPYCYKMIEENFKHAPYTDFIKANFEVIALNIRGDREVALDAETSLTEKALAAKLKVMFTPTVLFLDSGNQVVARVNGYREAGDFKRVLDYVQGRHYKKTSLTAYLDSQKSDRYTFRDHPQLQQIKDLLAVADKPLALLFEDKDCTACDALHDGHLRRDDVNQSLRDFTFVRLDALSDAPIVDVEGIQTTPRQYAERLELSYRPSIVLFDKGKEIMRIQSMLYPYHFREILRYVGKREYEKYPGGFYDYLGIRTETIRARGEDVNVGE